MLEKVLKITHNAGFFSCCTIRLLEIINYFNLNKELPLRVDSSVQFDVYKNENIDITNDFYQTNDNFIEYKEYINVSKSEDEEQFSNYDDLNFELIIPFVYKYFDLSKEAKDRVNFFTNKYNIDFDNTCSVFYRGLDKVTETEIGDYNHYIEKCKWILSNNKDIKFLIQTDELNFQETFLKIFPNSLIINELPTLKKQITVMHNHIPREKRVNFAIDLLASTYIVSKCKFLVTHSGNCGLWAVLFRGNTINTYQFITASVISGKKYNFWNK